MGISIIKTNICSKKEKLSNFFTSLFRTYIRFTLIYSMFKGVVCFNIVCFGLIKTNPVLVDYRFTMFCRYTNHRVLH